MIRQNATCASLQIFQNRKLACHSIIGQSSTFRVQEEVIDCQMQHRTNISQLKTELEGHGHLRIVVIYQRIGKDGDTVLQWKRPSLLIHKN